MIGHHDELQSGPLTTGQAVDRRLPALIFQREIGLQEGPIRDDDRKLSVGLRAREVEAGREFLGGRSSGRRPVTLEATHAVAGPLEDRLDQPDRDALLRLVNVHAEPEGARGRPPPPPPAGSDLSGTWAPASQSSVPSWPGGDEGRTPRVCASAPGTSAPASP